MEAGPWAPHAALNSARLRADFRPLAEAGERWRGVRFDQQVLHMPDGGQLNPEAALPAFQRLAVRNGAAVRHHVKVLDLKILDGGVRLTVDDGADWPGFNHFPGPGFAARTTAALT